MEDFRVGTAAKFLLQSPPGEVNDVLHDVRAIVSDDEALQPGVISALEEYNIVQFTTVDAPGCDYQVLISDAARLRDPNGDPIPDRFVDPRSKQSFAFDHLKLEASDPQPVEVDESLEIFRVALEASTLKYVSDHYPDGVASVFTSSSPSRYAIQFVANKYNPPNFWSGRWRSDYVVDLSEGTLTGTILVNVHYYEAGNVQLSTKLSTSSPLPHNLKPESAPKILALIEEREKEYQTSLGDVYFEMGENTFKGLRRSLPITKQKLDWDRVMGYKLGAELNASNRGVFGSS